MGRRGGTSSTVEAGKGVSMKNDRNELLTKSCYSLVCLAVANPVR